MRKKKTECFFDCTYVCISKVPFEEEKKSRDDMFGNSVSVEKQINNVTFHLKSGFTEQNWDFNHKADADKQRKKGYLLGKHVFTNII